MRQLRDQRSRRSNSALQSTLLKPRTFGRRCEWKAGPRVRPGAARVDGARAACRWRRSPPVHREIVHSFGSRELDFSHSREERVRSECREVKRVTRARCYTHARVTVSRSAHQHQNNRARRTRHAARRPRHRCTTWPCAEKRERARRERKIITTSRHINHHTYILYPDIVWINTVRVGSIKTYCNQYEMRYVSERSTFELKF